jgi:hypothetical protein
LFELAGYSNVSATSYGISSISNPPTSVPESTYSTVHTARAYTVAEHDKKLYIQVFINKLRTVALVDSGSDLSILQFSLYSKLNVFHSCNMQKSDIYSITTFSNEAIKIKGKISWIVKLSPDHPGINVNFYIIEDRPNIPDCLVGNDLLKSGLGHVGYSGSVVQPRPLVIFKHPTEVSCTVYLASPLDTRLCSAYCKLNPGEKADIEFALNPAAAVIRTDHILISSTDIDDLLIIPSRSDLTYCPLTQSFKAMACVINVGTSLVEDLVTGKIELVNTSTAIPINDSNVVTLRQTLSSYPIGKELLQQKSESRVRFPFLTINALSTLDKSEVLVNDLDYADLIHEKEPTYEGEAIIDHTIIDGGLDIPNIVHSTAADAVGLHHFPVEIRPFIKDIFIEKYPHVVSLHSLDAGDLSKTLGYTSLRLRQGETLPRSKRIFHVSPGDQRHLDDILDLLLKFNYIIKSPIVPTGYHLYGMSAYLIPRSKSNSLGRLIVDYSPVNSLIESPVSVIPELGATLQFLQGKAIYTSLDLRQAYLALRIDEESRPLTTFITANGSYQWLSLPTGAANSPIHFANAINRVLQYEPVLDDQGNFIYESKNVIKQEKKVLPHTTSYFDDILIASDWKNTFSEMLISHFQNVEEAVRRLACHGCKISVPKCEFAKSKILFLGWIVCRDFIMADPRRINKIREFKFPDSKKAARAFLGLVNSLRRVISLPVVEQMSILTPLTSSKENFEPTEKHVQAFEEIKRMLVSAPLYNNLIDEKAEKYMWCDASTSSGVIGAVLAQKKKCKPGDVIVPNCLDLDDPVHRIIFDAKLPFEPAVLYTELPMILPTPSVRKTIPPRILTDEPLLGFTPENVKDSFFWSVLSLMALYNCAMPKSVYELRKLAMKQLRGSILNSKLKDFVFNLNIHNYHIFVEDFLAARVGIDYKMYLIEALAIKLQRPMTVISTLPEHSKKKIIHFNANSDRPPLVFGLYEREREWIFLPFYFNKHTEFNLESLRGKLEIVAYSAKTVPEGFRSRSILDLEVYAILNSLYSFQRFISGVPVKLLTDSRVLFYLFNAKIGNSSVKIKRWCLKLISDYPLVTLHFVRTSENLADFLTREGMVPGDAEKFNLKDIEIKDFYSELPKSEFTLQEWSCFVNQHPEYLTIATPKAVTLALNRGIENLKAMVTPFQILQTKISREAIVTEQKRQYADIYGKCLAGDNFVYEATEGKETVKYQLISDLIMIYKPYAKILIPDVLIGPLLAYIHLNGHLGVIKLIAGLQSYYFPTMYTIAKRFCQSCYGCFLSYKGKRKAKLGVYPMPTRPFEEVILDLMENLNQVSGYSHLLICQCTFSDFVTIIPLKTKTSGEVTRAVLNSILQPFNVNRIHTDNATCFRAREWLETMAALNVKIIGSAALHPAGRGKIEVLVGTVKVLLRKMLSTQQDLNWDFLPFLASKMLNNSVSATTGYTPMSMVYGADHAPLSFLSEEAATPHYFVRSNQARISALTAEIKEMTNEAQDKITTLRLKSNERLNKSRSEKKFKVHDYVFVLDRSIIIGNPRVLRTKFSPSPYIVLRPLFTTCIVKRISDGFTTVYSQNDLKLYQGQNAEFALLPPEISKILVNRFSDLIDSDLTTITEFDPMTIPNSALALYEDDSNDAMAIENNGKRALKSVNDTGATPLFDTLNAEEEVQDDEFVDNDNKRVSFEAQPEEEYPFDDKELVKQDLENIISKRENLEIIQEESEDSESELEPDNNRMRLRSYNK